MKLEIGRYAGFCKGVKHAVDRTFAVAREHEGVVYTDGDLIHNPQTLELLSHHNVRTLSEDTPVAGKTVVVRAHGIPPGRMKELRENAAKVINLTCKDVAKVQSIVKKYSNDGYPVIIVGKKSHPEVVGLCGFAQESYVVYSKEDVAALPSLEKAVVVSQTTMEKVFFTTISAYIKQHVGDVTVVDTICDATELRQSEVRELSERNDAILVIGGKKSSNTRRLYEIAREKTDAFLISDIADVQEMHLRRYKRVGITAGASTPDWLIEEVVEEVRHLAKHPIHLFFEDILRFALYSNIFVALGAFFLSFAVADNVGIGDTFSTVRKGESPSALLLSGLLVALYYLSMSLLNVYINRRALRIGNRARYEFMYRYRYIFLTTLASALAGIVIIAFSFGQNVFMLTMFSLTLGLAYNLSYLPIPERTPRLFLFRFRRLPAFKSLIISTAVAVLLNGIPILLTLQKGESLGMSPAFKHVGFYISFALVFMLMFTRQALFEMRTAQSDRIAGIDGLLTLVRERYILAALYAFPAILLAFMIGGLVKGAYPLQNAKYLFAVCYTFLVIFVAHNKKVMRSPLLFELIVDSTLYVVGFLALFSS